MGFMGISLKPLQQWLGWRSDTRGSLLLPADGASPSDVVRVHCASGPGKAIFIPGTTGGQAKRSGEHEVRLTMETPRQHSLLVAERSQAKRYEGGDLFAFVPSRWLRVPERSGRMALSLKNSSEETVATASFTFHLNEGNDGESTIALQMGKGAFSVLFLQSTIDSDYVAATGGPDVSIREIQIFISD